MPTPTPEQRSILVDRLATIRKTAASLQASAARAVAWCDAGTLSLSEGLPDDFAAQNAALGENVMREAYAVLGMRIYGSGGIGGPGAPPAV